MLYYMRYYGELLELKPNVEENPSEKNPVETVQDAAMSWEKVARIWGSRWDKCVCVCVCMYDTYL